jgi:hypothetical protein
MAPICGPCFEDRKPCKVCEGLVDEEEEEWMQKDLAFLFVRKMLARRQLSGKCVLNRNSGHPLVN